ICLGMQMAVIEYARNVLGYENANSAEMNDNTPHPVITFMEEQKTITDKGGTMRLGGWDCEIKEGTRAFDIYGKALINERHRHRSELGYEYSPPFANAGMAASGVPPASQFVELIALPKPASFVAVQYPPDPYSTLANPHPAFVRFAKAAANEKCNLPSQVT